MARRLGRVVAGGKHLSLDGETFRVRGVTYGTFRARTDGDLVPDADVLDADFAAIAASGLNTVRTYTTPPLDVLDAAAAHSLRLIVGLDYHDWRLEQQPGRRAARRVLDAGRRAVDDAMRLCAGRPEVLAVSVGNEIPADLVRVHGIGAVEETLSELVAEVQAADRDVLATYTNFPSTEYLHVAGQDLITFNVFLERPEQLRPYLRHLQVVADDAPVVVTELGLASAVHGEDAQAESLRWQLALVDETGCAGATVFAWTDDWVVAEAAVTGWGFGLTDESRRPKPALDVVSNWARSTPGDLRDCWPTMSVVVCAHNSADTLVECLESLVASEYPDLEIVVCDDGSTDDTAAIGSSYTSRVVRLDHGGLSAARNAGIAAATGEIVAFVDSDAACHPDWPYYVALSLEDDGVAATGGPNLPFPDAAFVERAVAASPGGPAHVLVGDDRAEHVPGCNMAAWKWALDSIDGFDERYRTAGDDVDACWKLLDNGHEIAFAPAAQVFHHRRGSIRSYLRQQLGYGKAERIVATEHEHRFNTLGQARWAGFIYGGPRILRSLFRPIVYHGPMGVAPFQTIVGRRAEPVLDRLGALLPLVAPVALLGMLEPLSLAWLVAPVLVLAAVVAYATVVASATKPPRHERHPLLFRTLVAFLHVAQPLVRTWGRIRQRPPSQPSRTAWRWTGDRLRWLETLSHELRARGCDVCPAGVHDAWDLVAWRGPFVRGRVTTAVVWRWVPVHRLSLRPRRWAVVAASAGATAAVFRPSVGLLVVGLVVAAAIEATMLARTVRRAVGATTETRRAAADETPYADALDGALAARLRTNRVLEHAHD